ncbi:MAG: metallophosphoesterase [Verrucomicrobia bacterium]|nr:metallophosphoesterase [Verrucomicrobiota bacterium]MDA1066774.1 metallophosphoesterase [Verrucomicrobiota bacterium]
MTGGDLTNPIAEDQNTIFKDLSERIGEDALKRRMAKQAQQESKQVFQGKNLFNPDRIPFFFEIVRFCLRITGLYDKGRRHFLDVRIVTNEIFFDNLPPELDGLKLLQISDLHLDLEPELTPVIVKLLEGVSYDVAVVTGDYRDDTKGSITDCLKYMEHICGAMKQPVYGILGNHDPIELVPALEEMGLPMLMNETVIFEKNGGKLFISGIDDPHYYEGDDFEKLRGTVPEGAFSILLSHAPETHIQAAELGYDFVLAGHTHGGQICLPGGIIVIHNGDCPSYMLAGNWRYKSLKGYTSRGSGGCRLPIRFFCPPEITVHILRKTK